ncbi:MAG: hypothetical protein SX243_07835 [Acidobacteriota bacterium]|nr:hypothetical protein [Acidobacteriota bacterium]
MTTTQIFAELLVIGFGAFAWLLVLGAAIFGWEVPRVAERLTSWELLLPMLSLVYVLGIVVDRLADWFFDRWDKQYRDEEFESKEAFYNARRLMVYYGKGLWEDLEYGRSRLRICRGSACNSVALLVSLFILWITRADVGPEHWFQKLSCTFFLLAITVLCVACWRKLVVKEYRKTKRQSKWLNDQLKKRGYCHD